MALTLSLRVSWLCLLLISSAACFPATKGDYRYPYTATRGSGSASGSTLQSEGSRRPLVSLQPVAAPQRPSSNIGNQSPSSLGAPSVSAGSSPSYEPSRFTAPFDSGSNKPSSSPAVPLQSAGYVSPPIGSGQKTPGFSDRLQPVGTGGNLGLGSVYEAPALPPYGFAYPAQPAGNLAPALDFSSPVYYTNTATDGFGDGPVSYGNPSDSGYLDWEEQPAGGASFYNPSSWMPSRSFPDFSAWDSNDGMRQSASETSPLPPSSYIIQSRNGFQRAREVLSHTKYSPEYPEPPVFASEAVRAPSKSAPAAFPKGAVKS